MQPTDQLIVSFILERGKEIYDAQKRFGADPAILASDRAYFNAIAMGLLQVSLAARKLSSEFCAKQKKVEWAKIGGWQESIVDRYKSLTAFDLWAALEVFAELHAACYIAEDSF
ncbi:MAG: hypothetical protein LBP89_07160 [Helicobacteraceae bacterium]|jgi:uncharacterized protein with HEPN domain|nr:hypothetical protein [Helicobacteraceae bacterium]